MNKLILILFLSFSFAVSAQKIDRKTFYSLTEQVEFRIFGIAKQKYIERGYNTRIIAEKGNKFVTIVFEFKNNSSEAKIVDFEKVFILDKKSTLHHIDYLKKAGVRFTGEGLKQKLKPKKKIKIIAQFRSSLPKDEIIDMLQIHGVNIQLSYN